jgi:iron complex transport system substrate-binding protein
MSVSRRAFVLACLSLAACKRGEATRTGGIVAIGGQVTEVLFALGAGVRVIGVDTSSVFPDEARKLPQVGYHRSIAAEGVVSLAPSLVILTTDAGPPPAVEQLKAARIPLEIVPGDANVEGGKERIRRIARVTETVARGDELIQVFEREVGKAKQGASALAHKPRVLFVFARGETALVVAGRKTGAQSLLDLLGIPNAIHEYEGYRPLVAEAAINARPDVIVVTASQERHFDVDAVLALPGLSRTPAGEQRRVVFVDALEFLGFGPRTGGAAQRFVDELAR